MTKTSTTKKKAKPKKRGPKEERLIISDDPKTALDRFLKTPPRKKSCPAALAAIRANR